MTVLHNGSAPTGVEQGVDLGLPAMSSAALNAGVKIPTPDRRHPSWCGHQAARGGARREHARLVVRLAQAAQRRTFELGFECTSPFSRASGGASRRRTNVDRRGTGAHPRTSDRPTRNRRALRGAVHR